VENQVLCSEKEEQVNVKRSKDFLRVCKRYCEYVYRLKREGPIFEVKHVIMREKQLLSDE
jgi:hypothetical protein